MRQSFLQSTLLLTSILFISGCATVPEPTLRKQTSRSPSNIKSDSAADAASTAKPASSKPLEKTMVFYKVHPDGNFDRIADLFDKHPEFRLTFIFPPHYFDAPERKAAEESFKVLQSSKQIEIALTLENEPILPLLGDLKSAGEKAQKWGVDFAWPDDISAQIARGNGTYQQRWAQLPHGLFPPYLALSDQTVHAAKRFRLVWVLGAPSDEPGVIDKSPTLVLIPPKISEGDTALIGTKQGAHALSNFCLFSPVTFIDGSKWPEAKTEMLFLAQFADLISDQKGETQMLLGQEAADIVSLMTNRNDRMNPYKMDYSPWVKSSRQRLAWLALAQARNVLKNYRNSGQASLQKLDAAFEEMHTAESGPFLLALGNNDPSLINGERNFLATLSNVYRLCGYPVPSNLSRWFADRGVQKNFNSALESDRPFFIEGPQQLIWNDATGDDFGDGKFIYPTGRTNKGAFDINRLTVTWTDEDVTFQVEMGAETSPKTGPIIPLIDIYIDVNRLPDAGSSTFLRGRGPAVIQREAAWEYALTMNSNSKALYQSVPGSEPRRLKVFKAPSPAGTVTATLSRSDLRGDPRQWRLTVVAMGMDSNRMDDLTPVRILSGSGEKNFGGAMTGREAPPLIDLLAPSVEDQTERMSVYTIGVKVTAPSVGGN